jgi:light-regulated signal transduction histidine kinase (bacteriophytochrome)
MSERDSPSEAEALRQQLAQARAALGEFAYVVSHDLRAQLRHILSYSSLLREELGSGLQGEPRQFLQTVTDAAQVMGRQIEGLREWVQLDRVELQPMRIDTAALIAEVRQQCLAQASIDPRAVQWRVADDLPPVQGDLALLRQLFGHVLSNALKFTRPRELALIEVGGTLAHGRATITVRDNGVGYNAAQQDQLFHVFKRLHSSSQFEGLGLGLALAHKIVQCHGGEMRIEGAVDAGCCVYITLSIAA